MSVRLRSAVALALSGAVLLGGVASAADAPKTSARSSTFFLSQEGCGTTAEPGRLIPKATADGATGCGTIGGLPLDEALAQMGEDGSEPHTTIGKGLPIKLDAGRKVTGQLAAESWFGAGVGAGTVTFDVSMTATDVTGKVFDFGTTTASADITPGDNVVLVPFSLPVPKTARGAIKSVTLNVFMHGQNLGFSAKHLDGDSYVVLPTRTK